MPQVGFSVTEQSWLTQNESRCMWLRGESTFYLSRAAYMFTSQRSIIALFLCIHWLSRLLSRIMNELCSKL